MNIGQTVGAGRHFLQIPGPTNVPDRVLRAIASPTIDHRGPDFATLTGEVMRGLGTVFGHEGPIAIFPSSGTGAWEAALVNTLSPGDLVLAFDAGFFAIQWQEMARRLGLRILTVPSDWRRAVPIERLEEQLSDDREHAIRAVLVVHNETSTGATSDIGRSRSALDRASHPALLLVDAVSSLGSIEYRHDEWEVDVTISCSQKGLMLPPGLGFNAMSERALMASRRAGLNRSYWDWAPILESIPTGRFPYTPSTNLLFGLRESLVMLQEEGLDHVFARHQRHADAVRAAVSAWDWEILCSEPSEQSNTVTGVLLPKDVDADELRGIVLNDYNLSLGAGLGQFAGRVFRIGHLGELGDLTILGTIAGIELGMHRLGVGVGDGADGIASAMRILRTPLPTSV